MDQGLDCGEEGEKNLPGVGQNEKHGTPAAAFNLWYPTLAWE